MYNGLESGSPRVKVEDISSLLSYMERYINTPNL